MVAAHSGDTTGEVGWMNSDPKLPEQGSRRRTFEFIDGLRALAALA